MIGSDIFLSEVATTSTEALAPVGTVRSYMHETYGYQQYRLVKASAAIGAFKVAEYDNGILGAASHNDSNFAVSGTIAGVAQNDIASGSYGWVVCSGICKVTTAASVAAGAAVVTKGAVTEGTVDDTDFGDVEESIIGIFTELAGSATTTTMRVSGLL